MLCPLSWDDDNWRSMIDTLGIYNHALTVVIRRWQLTEHVSYMNDILPCSDCCHEMKTTDKKISYHMDIDYINRKKKVPQVHSREHVHFHMEALLWHLSV